MKYGCRFSTSKSKSYVGATILFWAIFIFLAPVATAYGRQRPVWKVIKGGFSSYNRSQLITPVSVYVIDRSGSVVGVIKTGGNYTQDQRDKTSAMIRSRRFVRDENDLSVVSHRLTAYLGDLGYDLKSLSSKESSYTVIMTAWNTADLNCSWLRDASAKYKRAIANAFTSLGGKDRYGFVELKLSPGQVAFSCPKKRG